MKFPQDNKEECHSFRLFFKHRSCTPIFYIRYQELNFTNKKRYSERIRLITNKVTMKGL